MSTISWKNVFVEQYDVVLAIADGGGDNDKMTFESFLIGNFFFEMYNLCRYLFLNWTFTLQK